MKYYEIYAQEKHLKDLFARASFFKDEPELLSHWAKYLCVLTSGFIETCVKHYLSEFAENKSHPYVSSYVSNHIEGFQNPNMEKILTIVGAFSEEWRNELEKYVDGERKDAVDSVVANRHNIAHGKSTGLTLARMHRYFEKVLEVLEFIKNQVTC